MSFCTALDHILGCYRAGYRMNICSNPRLDRGSWVEYPHNCRFVHFTICLQSIGYAPDIRAQDSSASEQAGFLDPSNVADAPGTAASEVNVTFLTSTASPGPDMLNTAVMSAGAALVLMLLILALVVLLFIRIRQRKKGVPEDRQTSKIQVCSVCIHVRHGCSSTSKCSSVPLE